MRIIIAGSRGFNDYKLLKDKCFDIIVDMIFENKNGIERKDIEIISGTANGADKLGEKYANEKHFKLKKFPANWDKYGKSAGYRRNEEMAIYAKKR